MLDFSRLTAIGREKPLLHCVSNIVSANDCANVGLAVGASPMMAQAPEEMAEITARSAATVLNTGTPSAEKFSACMICGVESQRLGKPVVLDPVGIGASAWRLRWADELLAAFHPEILRVNFGEARALAHGAAEESGVDSLAQASTMARLALARRLARRRQRRAALRPGGHRDKRGLTHSASAAARRTAQVTGAGCRLSGCSAARLAAVEPTRCRLRRSRRRSGRSAPSARSAPRRGAARSRSARSCWMRRPCWTRRRSRRKPRR